MGYQEPGSWRGDRRPPPLNHRGDFPFSSPKELIIMQSTVFELQLLLVSESQSNIKRPDLIRNLNFTLNFVRRLGPYLLYNVQFMIQQNIRLKILYPRLSLRHKYTLYIIARNSFSTTMPLKTEVS